jgi:prephenate dehydrogenase
MTSAEAHPATVHRLAVVGTGLIGTSVALAAARVGCEVVGWDEDPAIARSAADRGGFKATASLDEAVVDAGLVVVATPIPATPAIVAHVLSVAPGATVTDVGSIKVPILREVTAMAPPAHLARYVPGHPMGGSERSGPQHASASLVDDIVWVLAPGPGTDPSRVEGLEGFVELIGARPVRIDPERHDRLVAFVSHLPQVASSGLMALAATEERDEPEILLLAAGGFRDLTRLAASNPALWSDILLANREQVGEAIDLYVAALERIRDAVTAGAADEVERTFQQAKTARLRLAAKPQVRAGVAILQVLVPDRPGSLARLTAVMGEGGVNIEDLQIVHSPEGGRGTVHLTVSADSAAAAEDVLGRSGFDPIRLA